MVMTRTFGAKQRALRVQHWPYRNQGHPYRNGLHHLDLALRPPTERVDRQSWLKPEKAYGNTDE